MDGKLLLRELRDLLNEQDNSSWFNDFTGYNYLFQAAIEFVGRTNCLHGEATITTVANLSTYDLPADFLQLYVRDDNNTHVIKYYNASSYQMIPYRSYEKVYYENQTTAQSIPNYFSVLDSSTSTSSLRLTGTSTFDGVSIGGQAVVADTTSSFASVSHGDIIHNTTDGSYGMVLEQQSTTALVTAMFGGTSNDWSVGDGYVIQPRGRYQIVLDPKPSTSGHTVYVPYTQRPVPVFSDYGMYRFPTEYTPAIVKYAFWLYKYRDSQPKVGDAMYQYFDQATKRWGSGISERLREMSKFRVNLRAM
jgi:hypothetical protein